MKKFLFALSWLAFAPNASAIYRCDTPGGTVYSDAPCATGRVTDITGRVTDAASEEGASESRKLLAQQKKTLSAIEKTKAKEEREQETASRAAARIRLAQNKKCASLALNVKWAEEDVAAANGKTQASAQKKAQRAQEKHALECAR